MNNIMQIQIENDNCIFNIAVSYQYEITNIISNALSNNKKILSSDPNDPEIIKLQYLFIEKELINW